MLNKCDAVGNGTREAATNACKFDADGIKLDNGGIINRNGSIRLEMNE